MTTYRVNTYRDGKWWMVRIPELDGVNGSGEALTQARSRDEIETMAREYIALVTETADEDFEVSVHVGEEPESRNLN